MQSLAGLRQRGLLLLLAASTLLPFALSFWLSARFSKSQSYFYIPDQPNARSLHTCPTSRGGGIAVLMAIYGPGAMVLSSQPDAVVLRLGIAGLVLAAVAYVDDRQSLAPVVRLLVHLIVAVGLVLSGVIFTALDFPGGRWEFVGWLGATCTAVWIVWMINLYNFMDGMDGYAGGMAVVGFGTLAVLGWAGSEHTFALSNAIIAAASLGFLALNFPPARIFMGDTGSSTLGCFAAGMAIWGAEQRIFPSWIVVLLFSPFIVDATVTLLRRLVRGEKVWKPHHSHFYQRLVQVGWGHRRTVLLQYVFMVGCSISAVVSMQVSAAAQWGIVVTWALIYALYFISVSILESRAHHSSRSSGSGA